MALYSVWDWDKNAWAIYATQTTVSVGDDPVPPRPQGISILGANPDTDVKPLPTGAKFMGHDHLARGEVRKLAGALSGDDAGQPTGVQGKSGIFLIGAAVGAALMWLWRKL